MVIVEVCHFEIKKKTSFPNTALTNASHYCGVYNLMVASEAQSLNLALLSVIAEVFKILTACHLQFQKTPQTLINLENLKKLH